MSSDSMTNQVEGVFPQNNEVVAVTEVAKPLLTEHPLLVFLKHFVLPHSSDESHVLQRLKLLSSASKQYVRFKVISNGQYLVYTEYDQAQVNPTFEVIVADHLYKFDLYQLFPSRSVIVSETEDGCQLDNYSITRVINVNPQVFVDAMTRTGKLAQAAYEGTTLVAYHTENGWKLRTTSCLDAFDSYYSSEKSHGELFEEVCQRNFGKSSSDMFDELSVTYPDSYFVFVLVARECQHICDHVEFTDGTEVILIHSRTNVTHVEHDVKVQQFFKTSAESNVQEVMQTLATEHQFADKFVQKQGFVLVDERGYLIRVLTGAYYFATTLVPMHNNAFETALHCYLLGTFHRFSAMQNMLPEVSKTLFDKCSITVSSVSNLLAFALTTFTNLDLRNRSYRKVNGSVFQNLKKNNSYLRVLPMLQTHAIKSRVGFKDFKSLSHDVEMFVKSFGSSKELFEQFLDLVCDYVSFQTDLNTCIEQFNIVELERNPLRTFVNNYDEQFKQVVDAFFKSDVKEEVTN